MDLITEIAKTLNITFEFMITEKSLYPNLQKDLIERVSKVAIKYLRNTQKLNTLT